MENYAYQHISELERENAGLRELLRIHAPVALAEFDVARQPKILHAPTGPAAVGLSEITKDPLPELTELLRRELSSVARSSNSGKPARADARIIVARVEGGEK